MMKHEIVKSDITVVGGGLAGVCAAIAAARLGQTVSLVQNRPVLGGIPAVKFAYGCAVPPPMVSSQCPGNRNHG